MRMDDDEDDSENEDGEYDDNDDDYDDAERINEDSVMVIDGADDD